MYRYDSKLRLDILYFVKDYHLFKLYSFVENIYRWTRSKVLKLDSTTPKKGVANESDKKI